MHVDLASRSAHHRKHGATFADTWTTRDGTTFVAVGAVVGGGDRVAVSDLLHATTIGSNTILEGKGAPTALITTRGFRDVLEIRDLRMPRLYDLHWTKPPALT